MTERAALVKLLVERLGRHKPRYLTEAQTVAVIRRLIKRALAADSGCCLWGGARNNDGYGKLNVRLGGKVYQLYVHKLAHELAHDPRELPVGMEVAHACDTPRCFHPEHVGAERRKANRQKSAAGMNAKKAMRRARPEEMKEAA